MTTSIEPRNPSTSLHALSDAALIDQIQALTRDENEATVQILYHLNEIERRRLELDMGYTSLFDYCIRGLEYSPSAAGRRIQAARCIRRFPAVVPLLRERELNLSTISLIEPILTGDNFAVILERVRGASYRDVERVVSEYRPPVAFRDRVQPVRVVVSLPAGDVDALTETEQDVLTPGAGSADKKVRIEQKLLVQFVASEELMHKLEEAKSLLSHRCSEGKLADVFDVIVSEFLERHSPVARQKRREAKRVNGAASVADAAEVAETGANGPDSRRRECDESRSRHISNEARDEVFARDQGRCAFVARDGTRCGSRKGLEIDHVRPFAHGGGHEVSNLRLLCGAHNRRAAEVAMGVCAMAPYWKLE